MIPKPTGGHARTITDGYIQIWKQGLSKNRDEWKCKEMCVTDRQCWKGTERHGLINIEGHAMSYYSCLLSDLSLSFSSWHDFRELRKRGKRDTSYYFLAHLTGGRVKAAHPFGSLQPQSWRIWHVTRFACLRQRLQNQIYQWAFFFSSMLQIYFMWKIWISQKQFTNTAKFPFQNDHRLVQNWNVNGSCSL